MVTSEVFSVENVVAKADEDGLLLRNTPQQCSKLDNSVILTKLTSHLAHLPDEKMYEVIELITSFPSLFSDVPSQTRVLQHDIDVQDAKPIKMNECLSNECC